MTMTEPATVQNVDMRLRACLELHRLALFQGDLAAVDRCAARLDELLDLRHELTSR